MRCHICDKALSEAEIQVTPDGKGFEPCSQCMEVILDAAYSDGFVRPDDLDEVETLDEDTNRTQVDEYRQYNLYDDVGFQEDDDTAGY